MQDPDEVWQQARDLNAAWDRILDRVHDGKTVPPEAAAEVRALLAAAPLEVLDMASRFMRLKSDLRREQEGR